MRRTLAVLAVLAALTAAPGGLPRAAAAGPVPTIATISPSKGPAAGGTTVTITGTDFSAPMEVSFGGTRVLALVTGPTTLTCLTPAHARGKVAVTVFQTTPPETASAPTADGFEFEDPPYFVWVPRAPGSATGGNPGGSDVSVVDIPNRKVVLELNLNATDLDLPTDDAWSVTQVLFDATGDYAFLATAGTPGLLDSEKVFVVRTSRVVDGTLDGDEVVSVIDTGGNPYQLALSRPPAATEGALETTLFVADGGPWEGAALNLPAGTFRAYNVADRANPVLPGTEATVGVLPVLAYDGDSQRRWGRNSSFLGRLQSQGNRTVVTNAASRTLSVIDLEDTKVVSTRDVAGTVTAGMTNSLPSPYSDDFVYLQTVSADASAADYFVYRISRNTLIGRGAMGLVVPFLEVALGPPVAFDVWTRRAWPHPDGESLVALPATDASVATLVPSTGAVPRKFAVQGGGAPRSLAYNDATGLFYAREKDGGWTVLAVPEARAAAPELVVKVEDATGIDSLRVVGDGSLLVGTAASTLALIEARTAVTDAHKVVATVPLGLDPAGGPAYPQPGVNGGAARTFVALATTGALPQISLPLTGTEFDSGDDPPEIEFTTVETGEGDPLVARYELEIGSQYDFLVVPGAARYRLRVPLPEVEDAPASLTATPPRRGWLRVLRAAAGSVTRPFFARAVAVLRSGARQTGPATSFRVRAPVAPVPLGPPSVSAALLTAPPTFKFQPGETGRHWIEFARREGFDEGVIGRFRVPGSIPADASPVEAVAPSRVWRAAGAKARGKGHYPAQVLWRVRCVDVLGRETFSGTRAIWVSESP